MSTMKPQATTIPMLLIAIACATFMMEASLGQAEPIAPSPYAPAPDAYGEEFSTSVSNPRVERVKLLRLAAVLSQLSLSSAVPRVPLPAIGNMLSTSRDSGLAGVLEDAEECFASIINTKDCPLQIINSIITLELQAIEPECCRAVLSVQEGCLAKIPLLASLIPSVLRDACSHKMLAN